MSYLKCPTWAASSFLVGLSTALAVFCRLVFDWAAGPASTFLIPFLLPVVVTALYCGMRWGLLATALNASFVAFIFTPPEYRLDIQDFDARLPVGTFLVLGVILSQLIGTLRIRRQRAEENARSLTLRQHELQAVIFERRATEDRLRHSERRYRALVQASLQVVWTSGGADNEEANW